MIKILFLCHGNICRSPMAEFMFKDKVKKLGLDSLFYVESKAVTKEEIGNPIYFKARKCLENHHIYTSNHYASIVTKEDYQKFDLIFIMDQENEYYLNLIIGSDVDSKVKFLGDYLPRKKEIEDPWYSNNFEKVYEEIDLAIDNIINEYIDK